MAHQNPQPEGLDTEQLLSEFRHLLETDLEVTIERMRDSDGKIILNSDDLFKVLPRYDNNPDERITLGPLLYPVARKFTDKIFKHLLSRKFKVDDTVIFTAGGSATGKSTILRSAGQQPGADFIVDTTLSDFDRAVEQIDSTLASGRKVEIHYVYRDFRESVHGMVRRAQDRQSGRIVPIDDMARTHFGSQRTILALLAKYQDNRRVAIRLRANDGKGKLRHMSESEFVKHLHPSVDFLQKLGQSILDGLLEDPNFKGRHGEGHHVRWSSLRISQAFYEAARSKTQGRGTSSRPRHARKVSKGGGNRSA